MEKAYLNANMLIKIPHLESCNRPTDASQKGVSGKRTMVRDPIRGTATNARAESLQSSKMVPIMYAIRYPSIVPDVWKVIRMFLNFECEVSEM